MSIDGRRWIVYASYKGESPGWWAENYESGSWVKISGNFDGETCLIDNSLVGNLFPRNHALQSLTHNKIIIDVVNSHVNRGKSLHTFIEENF